MALKGPQEYWNGQASQNYIAAAVMLVALLVLLGGGGGGIYWVGSQLLETHAAADAAPGFRAEFLIERAATVGILAALLFVAIRVVSRLLMSFLHAAGQARERSVMITTFLALRTDDPESVATAPLLAAIFRPTSSGLIKEDVVSAPSVNVQMPSGSASKP